MMELGMVPPLEGRDAAIFPIFRENSSTIASNAPFLMQFLQWIWNTNFKKGVKYLNLHNPWPGF